MLLSPPRSWQRVSYNYKDNVEISEYIPAGQTPEEWKERITVQIMHGVKGADPESILGKLLSAAERACDNLGARVIPFQQGSDYSTRGVIQGCGHVRDSPYGEFTIIRAIAGKNNLYVIQKAWRLPAWETSESPGVSDDEILKWLDYLGSARVCDTRERNCPEATGH